MLAHARCGLPSHKGTPCGRARRQGIKFDGTTTGSGSPTNFHGASLSGRSMFAAGRRRFPQATRNAQRGALNARARSSFASTQGAHKRVGAGGSHSRAYSHGDKLPQSCCAGRSRSCVLERQGARDFPAGARALSTRSVSRIGDLSMEKKLRRHSSEAALQQQATLFTEEGRRRITRRVAVLRWRTNRRGQSKITSLTDYTHARKGIRCKERGQFAGFKLPKAKHEL